MTVVKVMCISVSAVVSAGLAAACGASPPPALPAEAPREAAALPAASAPSLPRAVGPIAAPRLLAPMTGSALFTARPELRVELAPDTDGAEIELCRDRGCERVFARLLAKGRGGVARASVTEDLPAGDLFWRARGARGDAKGESLSPAWHVLVRTNPPGLGASTLTFFDPPGEDLRSKLAASDRAFVPIGDVDGDGLSDGVGAECSLSADDCTGRLLFYPGAGGPALRLATPWPVKGGEPVGWIPVGDVNGDGHADAVLSSATVAWLFLGGHDGLGGAPARRALRPGYSIAGRRRGVDVNGDGFADYVALHKPRTVSVHYGSASGLRDEPDVELDAPTPSGCFGDAIDLGDVNGDGFADIVVGDYCGGPRRRGALWIFFGGSTPSRSPLLIEEPEAERKSKAVPHFGIGVTVVDGDGDGVDDIYATTACYLDDREKKLCDGAVTYVYRGARDRIAVERPARSVAVPRR